MMTGHLRQPVPSALGTSAMGTSAMGTSASEREGA
jgi:hypothetical protein